MSDDELWEKLEPISEEQLARVARIVGPSSAAQLTLNDVAKRRADGEQVEIRTDGARIVVRGVKYPDAGWEFA